MTSHSQQSARASLSVFVIALAAWAAQIIVLDLLGRPWLCPCGHVKLWQQGLDPTQNSQQIGDTYSLLHFVFGCGLFAWLHTIRPHWPLSRKIAISVISSAIWEVIENLPFVVERFGSHDPRLRYVGDSIINSVSDTMFVVAGVLIASRIPARISLTLALLIEIASYVSIKDGLIPGAIRLFTG